MSINPTESTSKKKLKILKSPDKYLTTIGPVFEKVAQKPQQMTVLVFAVIGLCIAIAGGLIWKEKRANSGRDRLFAALETLDKEQKALNDKTNPPVAPQDPKAKTPPVANPVKLPQKVNVDETFPQSVKELSAVADQLGGATGFQAKLSLADLYLAHGQPDKAAPWFEKAVADAPSPFEKALTLSSQGVALENAGKFLDAANTYQKAFDLKKSGTEDRLLIDIGRNYEAAQRPTDAAQAYEKLSKEYPNSPHLQYAKNRLATLKPASGEKAKQ